jgi:hypothetical protein
MRTTLLACLLLSSCSGVQVKQRADGTYAVECSSRKACLDRAERVCGNEGFTIVGGRSNKKRYGVPGNEKLVGKDEMFIRCNSDRPGDTPDDQVGIWRLPKPDASDAHSAAPPMAKPESSATPSVTKPMPSAVAPEAKPAPSTTALDAKSETVKPPVLLTCRPGETQRCVGPAACEGGQACLSDGSGFGTCDCGGRSQESTATTPAKPRAPATSKAKKE